MGRMGYANKPKTWTTWARIAVSRRPAFPTASALASSWDTALIQRVGEALGQTCVDEDVSVLLGPGLNIKRSPLCGRNFEYFSEDPFLNGHIAASLVNGIQSQGVGACLKHFAVNNQERGRMFMDAIVDDRTLREIYLKGFEIAVKASQPVDGDVRVQPTQWRLLQRTRLVAQ